MRSLRIAIAATVAAALVTRAGAGSAPLAMRPAPPAFASELVELVVERSELEGTPTLLEVASGSREPERRHVHALAFRERFGVHWTPPQEGEHRLRLVAGDGRTLGSWTLQVRPARGAREPVPAERWLVRNSAPGSAPELAPDAQPRLMQAVAAHFVMLRQLADGEAMAADTVAWHAGRLAEHASRVTLMVHNFAPPWAPARPPPPPDAQRFAEIARALEADARELARPQPRRTPAELRAALDAIERDRCTACHLGFRFARLTRSDPARGPSGVYAAPLRVSGARAAVGDALAGAELFARHCHACHGAGERRGPARPLLRTEPANLRDPALLYQRSDLELARTVMNGGADRGLSAEMPPFGTTLGELEIWDLVAYLRARSAGPGLDFVGYEEMPWGSVLPLPDDADEELARVTVWRGRDAGGEPRFAAATPSGLLLVADGAGREIRRQRPTGEDGSGAGIEDLARARQALALAAATGR